MPDNTVTSTHQRYDSRSCTSRSAAGARRIHHGGAS
jgi:hypothetical protein